MDRAPGVLIENKKVIRPVKPAPRLRLLIEREPAHRVFLDNLADLLLPRRHAPIVLTSRPAPFWSDVFVPAGFSWSSFAESMVWHVVLVVLVVVGEMTLWPPHEKFAAKDAMRRAITYYPPQPSFPATGGRPSTAKNARPRPHVDSASAHTQPAPISVVRSQKPKLMTPPDIRQAMAPPPSLTGGNAVMPAMPFAETARLKSKALSTTSTVVPPAPDVGQVANAARPLKLPEAAAVAPAPDVKLAAGKLRSLDNGGAKVVPPPPSVDNAAASARMRSIGGGAQVVPPAPSLQAEAKTARVGALSGVGPQVIPPPPVAAAGGPANARRPGGFAAASTQVVPPPPALDTRSGGGSRASTAFAPQPGVARPAVSQPAVLQQVDDPPVANQAAVLPPMDDPPQARQALPDSTVEELPLGLVGMVFAMPGTSYFSNYEIFVAKRKLGKNERNPLPLIKLVYEFLPYQRRLSEYDLNNLAPRVIKLRVIPDPSCDESLGQMIQSHTDPARSASEQPRIPAALLAADMNAVLPCYRTSAGDFQTAMSKGH